MDKSNRTKSEVSMKARPSSYAKKTNRATRIKSEFMAKEQNTASQEKNLNQTLQMF